MTHDGPKTHATGIAGLTIAEIAAELSRGTVTSRALIDAALESIARDSSAFTRVYAREACEAADASDAQRARGVVPSPLAGIPISIKDLFDVRGEPTPAGSAVLRNAPPALRDAPVIARLRAAGAVLVGRTHMSEFAFSGLGTNPHLPRLSNPHDAARVPGGSSSGAAASVVRGQAVVGIGTDTGGSVRIPASYCGVTGFKPTQRRVTRDGAFPLAESLDSVGPLANSVACCALVDSIIADAPIAAASPVNVRQLRLAVPTDIVLDDLDVEVESAFARSLEALRRAGATISRIPFPEFSRVRDLSARGTIVNAESFAIHNRTGLLARRAEYDPNVRARMEIGERMTRTDYDELMHARSALMQAATARSAPFDALITPTMAGVAPQFDDVVEFPAWSAANARSLRNASLVNFFDRCALSIPMHRDRELPMGLMVVGETMGDARLLQVGSAVESALHGRVSETRVRDDLAGRRV